MGVAAQGLHRVSRLYTVLVSVVESGSRSSVYVGYDLLIDVFCNQRVETNGAVGRNHQQMHTHTNDLN